VSKLSLTQEEQRHESVFTTARRFCHRDVSGWDRLRLGGTLRMLANLTGMSRFLSYRGHLFKDFGQYAQEASRQVRQQALAVVERADRPVIHLDSPLVNKEQKALEIAARDQVSQGIIAALTAVESCNSYDVRSDRSRGLLELYPRPRTLTEGDGTLNLKGPVPFR
jgi:hypothetical protein